MKEVKDYIASYYKSWEKCTETLEETNELASDLRSKFSFLSLEQAFNLAKEWTGYTPGLLKEYRVVQGNLNYKDKKVGALPEKMRVEGYANFRRSSVTLLPDTLIVRDSLDLSWTNITSLPRVLKVGYTLDLCGCKYLTSLPEGLEVGGYLFLGSSGISQLPRNMYVKEQISFDRTPLEKTFTKEQFRKWYPGITCPISGYEGEREFTY